MCKDNAARQGLKVGDMVKVARPTVAMLNGGCSSWQVAIGRIGRIEAIGGRFLDGKAIVNVNGNRWWWNCDCLEKVRRRTKPRRRTANAKHEANSGASGAIRLDFFAPPSGEHEATVGAGAAGRVFPDGPALGSYSSYAVKPETPKLEPKFKIGDRVEVYRRSITWDSLWGIVGAVGAIIGVDARNNTYRIDLHDDRRFWWIPEYALRHAPAEPSPAT